jgi:hypothetical protein
MKPRTWLVLLSALAVSGCAGGSAVHATPFSPVTAQAKKTRLIPFSLPLVNDSSIESSLRSARSAQNSVGSIPTIGPTTAAEIPISIGLVDAPLFNLSQVNLAIERINAVSNIGTAQQTETLVQAYPGEAVVNLLDYQQTAANLGITGIPPGQYDALEIVCDPANSTIVTNSGQTLPITFGKFANGSFTPSRSGHGSLVLHYSFSAATTIDNLLVDLNVENSVNVGSSAAEFGASFFAADGNNAGAIGGTLVDGSGNPVANATAVVTDGNGNVMGLAPTDQSGNFIVHALNAGSYTITVYEKYTTAAGMTVTASDGQTGSLGPWQVTVPAGFEAYLGTVQD